MNVGDVRSLLKEAGLRITPQRLAVLHAIFQTRNHPTADQVIGMIRTQNPDIATGTVYKTLETLVGKGIIKKVKTSNEVMRYDVVQESHHHLYSSESERIEDYFDEELDEILDEYFRKKAIPGFQIEDVKLQIVGKFIHSNR
ncbi:MAG: transcriptional repressor [Bacteroidales bacterium]|nr:transcriptional repressor [Bacteroidales bacterium]